MFEKACKRDNVASFNGLLKVFIIVLEKKIILIVLLLPQIV